MEETVTELSETIEKSIEPTKATILKVNEHIYEMKEQNRNILNTVREVKADLVNLKAMLLSRYIFNFSIILMNIIISCYNNITHTSKHTEQ